MDIHLAVFDLTGTILEDRGEIEEAFTSALSDHGLAFDPARFASVRGKSKREALSEMLPSGDGRLDAIYASFVDRLERRAGTEGGRILPGVLETFEFLRERGVSLAFNTGLDRTVALALLKSFPLELVGAVVGGDEVPRGRPAPDLIFRAMERTGVDRVDRVLVVGDTVPDLEAGRAAGVRYNVGVLTGAHDRSRLGSAPHTHILASVSEIPSLW